MLDPFAFGVVAVGTSGPLQSQAAADLDDVVRDDSKADPSLHTFQASIAAAVQPMTTFQHADAALASGPPTLPGAEPTRSLQFSPLAAFGAPTRQRDSRHSHSLDGFLIL